MKEGLAFILGAIVGSFLNVVIYRLPRGLSIIGPRSFCPFCGNPIKPYDNIPLVSFLLLGGRCRSCRGRIPWRYPLVEGLTGLLALFCLHKFGLTLSALGYFAFLSALEASAFIDLEHRIIPDEISLGGTGAGVVLSLAGVTLPFGACLLGILVGAGGLFLVAWIYELLTKREGMGGGDIKLMGMIGAFLGPVGAAFAIFSGSFLGALIGLILVMRKGDPRYPIPFGPFLAAGASLYLLDGEGLIRGYLSLF